MTTPYTKNHMVILPPLAKGVVQNLQVISNLFKITNSFDSIIQKGSIQKYVLKKVENIYRGSPTSTVSTSTNSSSAHFQKVLMKFHLYDFPLKSPSSTK